MNLASPGSSESRMGITNAGCREKVCLELEEMLLLLSIKMQTWKEQQNVVRVWGISYARTCTSVQRILSTGRCILLILKLFFAWKKNDRSDPNEKRTMVGPLITKKARDRIFPD